MKSNEDLTKQPQNAVLGIVVISSTGRLPQYQYTNEYSYNNDGGNNENDNADD